MAFATQPRLRLRVLPDGFRTPIKRTLRVEPLSPLGRAAAALDDASNVHWVGPGSGATDVLYDVTSVGVAWLRQAVA